MLPLPMQLTLSFEALVHGMLVHCCQSAPHVCIAREFRFASALNFGPVESNYHATTAALCMTALHPPTAPPNGIAFVADQQERIKALVGLNARTLRVAPGLNGTEYTPILQFGRGILGGSPTNTLVSVGSILRNEGQSMKITHSYRICRQCRVQTLREDDGGQGA